jgi:N-acetylneuraminic acid mutarotase
MILFICLLIKIVYSLPIPGTSYCFGIVSTDPTVCSGHGSCISNDTCHCYTNWIGDKCNETQVCNLNYWSNLTSLPNATYDFAIAEVFGNIYVISGKDESGTVVPTVYIYDSILDTWTVGSPIPIPRYGSTAIVEPIINNIWVIGGINSLGNNVGTIDILDTSLNTWFTSPPYPVPLPVLPTPRAYLGAAVNENYIYVMGGITTTGIVQPVVEIYDFTAWYSLTPLQWQFGINPMPTPRYGLTAIVTSFGFGMIYAIGGVNNLGYVRNEVEVYNKNIPPIPINGIWASDTPIPTARAYLSSVSYQNAYLTNLIYVLGGKDLSSTFGTLEIYDDFYSGWTTGKSMQFKRSNFGMVIRHGLVYQIHAIGGLDENGNALDKHEVYTVPHMCFGYTCDDPDACSGHGICYDYNKCYCDTNYPGTQCNEWECYGIPAGYVYVCSGNGDCVDYDDCSCHVGYFGDQCGQAFSCYGILSNETGVCSDSGDCIATDTCDCDDGYVGDQCTLLYCYGKLSNDTDVCSGHGTCESGGVCNCFIGYQGVECDNWNCFLLSKDNPNVCSGNGNCTSPNNCECELGYGGLRCEIVLDCGLNYWFEGADIPVSRFGAASALYNDNIYVIGGKTITTVLNTVEIYHTSTDTWSVGVSIPTPRAYSSAIEYGGKIYVFGGRKQDGTIENTTAIFNIGTSTWTTGVPMPAKRERMGIVLWNNKIYLVGGQDGFTVDKKEIFRYDPVVDTWNTGLASMDITRNCLAATVYNGNIYAIGGFYTNTMEIYNIGTDSWSYGTSMISPRECLSSAEYNGYFYVFGSAIPSIQTYVEVYSTYTNSWFSGKDVPTGKHSWVLASYNGHLYAASGDSTVDAYDNITEIYSIPYYCDNLPCDDPDVCSNHGYCVGENNCYCESGYLGSECNEWYCGLDINTSPLACNQHGDCIAPGNCSCTSDWTGDECEFMYCFGIRAGVGNIFECSGHGDCVGTDVCNCSGGYSGANCQALPCNDV